MNILYLCLQRYEQREGGWAEVGRRESLEASSRKRVPYLHGILATLFFDEFFQKSNVSKFKRVRDF